MQDALDSYNSRLAKSHGRTRLYSGLAMCAGAALSWGLAALGAVSVLTDPKVGADFDSGTHTRNVAGIGSGAAICAIVGFLLLIGVVWRGPSFMRWIGVVILLLGGVPLLWTVCFAFALSR
ncbi:MAG: hypothetical protein QOI79_4246 [Mycobacterium sp.]|jgi:hypothetical protein|nr:hypothetical protein [Mycobacterium sp.]